MRLFYFAAWTDSGYLLGCDHQHETVISAAACISQPAGYVVAVENGRARALTDPEETEFQYAHYGYDTRLHPAKPSKQKANNIVPIMPADWLLN